MARFPELLSWGFQVRLSTVHPCASTPASLSGSFGLQFPPANRVSPSWFFTTLTLCSAHGRAGLLHPASGHEVHRIRVELQPSQAFLPSLMPHPSELSPRRQQHHWRGPCLLAVCIENASASRLCSVVESVAHLPWRTGCARCSLGFSSDPAGLRVTSLAGVLPSWPPHLGVSLDALLVFKPPPRDESPRLAALTPIKVLQRTLQQAAAPPFGLKISGLGVIALPLQRLCCTVQALQASPCSRTLLPWRLASKSEDLFTPADRAFRRPHEGS